MTKLKRQHEIPILELIGRRMGYRETKRGATSQGERVIASAYIDFPSLNLVINFRDEHNYLTQALCSNYKGSLLGEEQRVERSFYHECFWCLKEPLLDIKHIERKVKIQVFIWELYFLKIKAMRFFKRISPALIFLIKCIAFALILKLIL